MRKCNKVKIIEFGKSYKKGIGSYVLLAPRSRSWGATIFEVL
jgi:hypothetical protein